MMNSILLIARKEVKRRFTSSLVIGIVFGTVSALIGSIFWNSVPMISFAISVLILNFALFLLGANIISEEKSKGTYSFLLTLPLRDIEIILGKLFGLMLIMAPAIFINILVITSLSFWRGEMAFNYNYLTALCLYLLSSASLLILASSQFQRLTSIFLTFISYQIILTIPGAYWLCRATPSLNSALIFPIILITFSFFTPLVFGISEFLSLKIPLMAPMILQTDGLGAILSIFQKLPKDPAFTLINLFSPLWNSSLLLLGGSDILQTHSFVGPISIFSIIFMVVITNLLASYQLRQRTIKVIPIFLLIALIPLAFGFIVSL